MEGSRADFLFQHTVAKWRAKRYFCFWSQKLTGCQIVGKAGLFFLMITVGAVQKKGKSD
jgi:hypothetical protein